VLPASLDSLLAQTYGDFELIISDDCSTDTTAQICRDYERRDSRVKYFCNARTSRCRETSTRRSVGRRALHRQPP
jgi:glycosyltransferase involved in cell wall biosynthesis